MPATRTVGRAAGRRGEDSDTASVLARPLELKGYNVVPFPILEIPVTGRIARRLVKPDLEIANHGNHFVSAKKGAHFLNAAFRAAADYSVLLPMTRELRGRTVGEVFAVTYPRGPSERFHLMVAPRAGHHGGLSFAPMEDVASVVQTIEEVIEGRFDEFRPKLEGSADAAKRLLFLAADTLAGTIQNVSDKDLESIFGGHDFFKSVLQAKLTSEEKKQALRMGPAFLFVNQIFFYLLLSVTDKAAGKANYPPIADEDRDQPKRLQDVYFARVRQKDYYPVYGLDVARFFKGVEARTATSDVIGALTQLVPSLDLPDLTGQVFQTLIPPGIRKPLGANYTNPNAASLLARIAVTDPQETVFDPACGSGTLLVASYRRKAALSSGKDAASLHKLFLERQITGIDVMAFSAHLAAVNLALQQPLEDTDRVRIGTVDSSLLKPDQPISSTAKFLPTALRQATLLDAPRNEEGGKEGSGRRGGVSLRAGDPDEFIVEKPDLIIMNPPFTSWENMERPYRETLRLHYENVSWTFKKILQLRPSQQLFFLLLADRFLDPGKTVAAVLPLTTFTGKSYHEFAKWFLNHYTVSCVFLGLARASFSEETDLTECMIVAKKGPPSEASRVVVVGAKKRPEEWSREDVLQLAAQATLSSPSETEAGRALFLPQRDMRPDRDSLGTFYLRLDSAYQGARELLDSVWQSLSLVQFKVLEDELGIYLTGGIRTGEHLPYYGSKALLICRSEDRIQRDSDRLVFSGVDGVLFRMRDRISGQQFHYPIGGVGPALRRFSFLPNPSITETGDFCLAKPLPELSEIMRTFYSAHDVQRFLRRINRVTPKRREGYWVSRLRDSSSRLLLVRRIDLASPGTRVLATHSKAETLVACEGYAVKGVASEAHEKLLALWFNSSIFLLLSLGHATITRGTWMKFEEFTIEFTPAPDLRRIGQDVRVSTLWEEVSSGDWPPLMEQLGGSCEFRNKLDDGILELLGLRDSSVRRKLSDAIRRGLRSVLSGLLKTMGTGVQDADELDADNSG